MRHRRLLAVISLLAACSSGSTATDPARATGPASSAEGAVRSFLKGVADSNLAVMATYWGSAGGPAIRTNQPPDWERRMVVMQAYLSRADYRIVSDVGSASDAATRSLQVELRRPECVRMVPFTAIRASDGAWLVNQVDLASAGSPIKPCPGPTPKDSLAPRDSV
ncbi:MAG TPA: hypothetical protein VFM14_06810 [Gemmatimonadales bacterium]|nr:hypothetical protein [Gemmatimonadales bacterium]